MRLGWFTLAAALLFASESAWAAWRKVETPTFVVYSSGRADQLTALAGELHEFDRLLRRLTGTSAPPAAKLEILLVGGEGEMRRIADVGGSTSGFYAATPGGVLGVALRLDDGFNAGAGEILRHEYAHHFTFQHFTAAYPPWYVENFAEYLMTARFLEGAVEIGRYDFGRVNGLRHAAWLPFDKVLGPSWRKLDNVWQAYGQSWLAVHWFNDDPARAAQLRGYLAAVARGTPSLTAFQETTGLTPVQFRDALRAYIADRRITFKRQPWPRDALPLKVVELSPVEDAMMLDRAWLVVNGESLDPPEATDKVAERTGRRLHLLWRNKMLGDLRGRATRFAGDPLADLIRAEAEIRLGDRAAGRALVEARLTAAPKDAQALYLKGLALVLDAEGKSGTDLRPARLALAAANRERPDDYRILAAYSRAQPRPLSPAALDVLLRTNELAPQVDTIALDAAEALIAAGRPAGARPLLVPIANAPHQGPRAKLARAALDALDGKPPATGPVTESPRKP